jgi:hypothetical protein
MKAKTWTKATRKNGHAIPKLWTEESRQREAGKLTFETKPTGSKVSKKGLEFFT